MTAPISLSPLKPPSTQHALTSAPDSPAPEHAFSRVLAGQESAQDSAPGMSISNAATESETDPNPDEAVHRAHGDEEAAALDPAAPPAAPDSPLAALALGIARAVASLHARTAEANTQASRTSQLSAPSAAANAPVRAPGWADGSTPATLSAVLGAATQTDVPQPARQHSEEPLLLTTLKAAQPPQARSPGQPTAQRLTAAASAQAADSATPRGLPGKRHDAVTLNAATLPASLHENASSSSQSMTAALPQGAGTGAGASAAAGSASEQAMAVLSILSGPPSQATPNAPMSNFAISAPLGTPQWEPELGHHLVTLTRHAAQGGSQSAELRLDPPELGPLRVTLTLADGVAQASFVSPHASVRQSVEAALEQLQQTLAQAGITLGQTSVSEQSAQDAQTPRGAPDHLARADRDTNEAEPTAATHPRSVRSDALLDAYA